MMYKPSCECGCDVRGLERYTLHAYTKNYDVKVGTYLNRGYPNLYNFTRKHINWRKIPKSIRERSIKLINRKNTFDQVLTLKYLNANEHTLGIEIGYFDNEKQAIEKAKKLINLHKNESNMQWFEVWDSDDRVYLQPNLEIYV